MADWKFSASTHVLRKVLRSGGLQHAFFAMTEELRQADDPRRYGGARPAYADPEDLPPDSWTIAFGPAALFTFCIHEEEREIEGLQVTLPEPATDEPPEAWR